MTGPTFTTRLVEFTAPHITEHGDGSVTIYTDAENSGWITLRSRAEVAVLQNLLLQADSAFIRRDAQADAAVIVASQLEPLPAREVKMCPACRDRDCDACAGPDAYGHPCDCAENGHPQRDAAMCDQPEDCPLGPEPHRFVSPAEQNMCCVRQGWEVTR